MDQNRAQWGSKIGFLLAAAGSAVGLGNIWKFPGKAFEGGGGAYAGQVLDGLILTVERPECFRPVTAGARLFAAIRRRHPDELVKDARPEWLDKLSGSTELRGTLGDPVALDALLARWREGCAAYATRERAVLYP